MKNVSRPPWVRFGLAIGLAVLVLGLGFIAVDFWLKPATLTALAREQQTPVNPVTQPLETESSPAQVSSQIQFPIRGAFYYAWYPLAWSQKNRNPYSNYQPSLGYYDSSREDVVKEHIAEMQYGNIQMGISAWFGQGSDTDKVFPLLLSSARGTGFLWTVYYEMPSIKDTSVDGLHNDLVYLQQHYAADPSFLKINGRFVVFVYNPASGGCDAVDNWLKANQGVNAYLVMKVVSNYRSCPSQPDGWHQFAPNHETQSQGKYSYTISPGFWQPGDNPVLARDPARWASDIQQMVTSGAQFQLIASFNDWGDGSAIEPATTWQSSSDYGVYLDALHNVTSGQAANTAKEPSHPAVAGTTPTATPPSLAASPTVQPSAAADSSIPAGDAMLLAAGDISSCANSGDFATAKILAEYPLAAIASLGDTVYEEGTAAQFAQCFNPAWGPYKDRIHPAVGNHEYLTPGASGYYDYFGTAAGDPSKGYYSYNLGAWHVIVLNSNCSKVGGCGLGSPEETWLKADLAAHPAKCTLAYWHHPRWSDGEHGNQVDVSTFWTDLYKAGADLVLSGHDHDYERFAPMDANGNLDPTTGIREFVVGTGGKNYYPFNATFAPTSQVHAADVFGILKLVLHPDSYDWQFIPEAGKSFTDSGSGVCH